MNKQDKWTDEVLNSLDGIQKATPSDALLNRIMTKLPKNNIMPKWQLRMTAAAACLLIALNIYVFDTVESETYNTSTSEYDMIVDDFSLYQ